MRYIKQSKNANNLTVFSFDINNEELLFLKQLAEDFLCKVPKTAETTRPRGRAATFVSQAQKALKEVESNSF